MWLPAGEIVGNPTSPSAGMVRVCAAGGHGSHGLACWMVIAPSVDTVTIITSPLLNQRAATGPDLAWPSRFAWPGASTRTTSTNDGLASLPPLEWVTSRVVPSGAQSTRPDVLQSSPANGG